MVVSSLQLLFLLALLLLRPSNLTAGMVQLSDLTPHCSLLRRRHEWGASPLLFCTIIWCLTRRVGCYMSHMSATGSTKFMKGSVDGGVYYYRIHERERLSFGKICFYGVRTTRVYKAHLKNICFSV